MDMGRNLEAELVDAFNQFGKNVTVTSEPTQDNRLYVKMYSGSKRLMDQAACSLAVTAPGSGTLFYPVWPKEDVLKSDKSHHKRFGVTIRIPLERASVDKVNAAGILTRKAIARWRRANHTAFKIG